MNIRLAFFDDAKVERFVKKPFLEKVLREYQVTVDVFAQHFGAVEQYAEYDGIILDYHFNGGGPQTGTDVARRIFAVIPHMPIVLYTGVDPRASCFEGIEMFGAQYVLDKKRDDLAMPKLIGWVRVIRMIKLALGRRSSINRLGSELRKGDPL